MKIKKIIPGIKQEFIETMSLFKKETPKSEKIDQIKDLGKIVVIATVFAIPFVGTVLTVALITKIKKLKPSSFQD